LLRQPLQRGEAKQEADFSLRPRCRFCAIAATPAAPAVSAGDVRYFRLARRAVTLRRHALKPPLSHSARQMLYIDATPPAGCRTGFRFQPPPSLRWLPLRLLLACRRYAASPPLLARQVEARIAKAEAPDGARCDAIASYAMLAL